MSQRPGSANSRRPVRPSGVRSDRAPRDSAIEPLEGRVLLATHLAPVADTFVRNNAFQDANFGASPFLWVKTSTPGGGDSRNAFLRFNVGGIDANSIGTATLYLSGALQSPTTAPITAGVFGVDDNSWQEGNGNVSIRRRGAGGGGGSQLTGTALGDGYDTGGGMDWNNQPAASAGPVATAVIDRDTFNTYAFDVTQYVRSQVAGGGNSVSMAVKGNEATTAFMRFISSNFDGPGKPQLVISRSDDSFVRANISASGISAGGGATHTVVVSYAADVPIDLSKFGTDDIRVRRADGAPLDVVNLSADQPFNSASVNVTYVIALPGGTADRSDNGVYTIELPRGQARDVAGNENAASFGSFRIAIDDAQPPSAAVVAGPVTAPGGNSYTFTVNYTDDVAIDAESVNINNVAVTGPNNTTLPVTQVTLTPDADNGQVAATYTVLAPNGEWDSSDNGTYSIVPRNNQVRDTAGHDLSESLGTFQVSIGPADDESPQVTGVSAPNVTAAGGTSHDVTVIYSDNVAIDVASIDATDITVSGPRGNLAVASPIVSQPTNGSPRTVTYRVTPPDGSWDAADNGAYTITVNAGAVRDTSGHGVVAATGSFEVNATGNDGTPPTATLSAAPDVTAAGGQNYSFTVVYGDNVAVRAGSLDAGDVTVAPEGGGGALQVVGVALAPNNDASQIAVTYTVAARGGSWDGGDNGRYVITLNGNQVADTSGNVIGGPVQIGAFQVAVPGADNQRPVPTISALNVTSAGAGAYSFTVTYADNVGINAGTVGVDDVSVTGPGGPLAVTSTQTLASGTDLVVTYFVTPPGNSWDAADNGAYTIAVGDGAVTDTSGNGNVGRSEAFHVNVNGGDQFGPQGTVTAPDVTAPGATATVTIKWQDDTAVRSNTIDVNDIIVSRGDANGPRLRVISADVTPKNNGPSVNAVYTVEALGGAWDPSDNGTYVVTIVPGEVRDTADGGHPAQAGSGTFQVNIADNANPTATITAPNITESTGERQKITVSYNDDIAIDITSIQGSSDLIITGPAGVGRLLPVSVTTSSSTNAPTIVVTYEIDPPGGTWDVSDNGDYTISVSPGSVKDAAGNAVTGSGTFTVSVAGEPPLSGPSIVAGFTIEGMVTQEDGKVVLVGRQASPNVPGGFQSVIQRRNIDGSLDSGFGSGGQVLGDPSSSVVFYAVALTNNGIVVAGSQDGHWVLARYNLLGQPDVTFGQGGRTLTTFNANNESAYALAVDPRDGKLVVGGGSPAGPQDGEADQNFAFARYLPGGALDVTFGQSGLQLFDINGEDVVGAITVRDDGRVVAAGSSGTNISLFQLSPNGEPDTTFSTDGYFTVPGLKARVDTGFFVDHSQALAIQDGKILVGNHTDSGDFGVVRVNPDGTVDPAFGQDGIATIDIGGTNDDVDSIVLQPTGEILAVGTSDSGVGGAAVTAVAALDRNGTLITGWNSGGKLTFAPDITPAAGRELHVGDLILRAFGTRQSDGRLVVGSSDRSPTPTSSAFRKIVVPGVTAQPIGEALGVFGVGSTNKGHKFVYTDADGTVITFSLKGNATGRVYLSGDKLNLRIEDLSGGAVPCSVTIKARGGDGRVALGDVICTGGLKSFNARTGDLSGTMYIPGMAGKLLLGNLTGTVAASGAITSLLATSLDGAKVLSGANLGSDAKLGGTGTGGDTFGQGFIGALKVAGAIKGSTVAAGLNPIDEIIGDEDDIVVGGVGAPGGPFSVIRSITAKGGADDASQFIAGGFKTVKLPKRVDPATDPQARFRVM